MLSKIDHLRVGDEQCNQAFAEQIGQGNQRAGDDQVHHQGRAGDGAQLFLPPRPNRLGAEDRGGDADRHGWELHIVQHLVESAIGSCRIGTEAIDQPDHHDAGHRRHNHLQPSRNP